MNHSTPENPPSEPPQHPSRLTITGFRRNGAYLVLIDAHQVWLTPKPFNKLRELVDDRLNTPSGLHTLRPDEVDLVALRIRICRLRNAIDRQTTAGTGALMIETVPPNYYRLTIPSTHIDWDPSAEDLPPF